MNKLSYILLLFVSLSTSAQYNKLLTKKDSINSTPKTLALVVDNLSFIKDNEYFNLIADGYTLFGNQTEVSFKYQAHRNYNLTAGFYALKYFLRT